MGDYRRLCDYRGGDMADKRMTLLIFNTCKLKSCRRLFKPSKYHPDQEYCSVPHQKEAFKPKLRKLVRAWQKKHPGYSKEYYKGYKKLGVKILSPELCELWDYLG